MGGRKSLQEQKGAYVPHSHKLTLFRYFTFRYVILLSVISLSVILPALFNDIYNYLFFLHLFFPFYLSLTLFS